MIAAAITPKLESDLADMLALGHERAAALKQPVLVSLVAPVSAKTEALSIFTGARPSQRYRIFWGKPDRDFWLVGIGRTAVISAAGPSRFADIPRSQRELLEGAVLTPGANVNGAGPVMLGGFRYDPRAAADPVWDGFPDALMVLPEFLFTIEAGRAWLTVNALLPPANSPGGDAKKILCQLKALDIESRPDTAQPAVNVAGETSKAVWDDRVNSVLSAIREGRLTKAVPARQKVLSARQPFSVDCALDRLVSAYPGCSVFAFDNGDAAFVGATPESLARVTGRRLTITCLAGSRPRGETPERDSVLETELRASPKERREHAAVVAMLASSLTAVCDTVSWPDTPQVIKLKNVQHLHTAFAGSIKPGKHILDIVGALHPTPAVAGTPTDAALDLVRQLEGDRGWYAGPVGWTDGAGSGEFAVAIRSALLRGNQAYLYAGAGIVAGSDASQEFAETETKFQPMLAALGGGGHAGRE